MAIRNIPSNSRPRAAAQERAQRRFLAALSKSGTISAACRAANVGRRTYYDWTTADPGFKTLVKDAQEDLADRLEEEAIRRATQENDGETLRFLLRGLRPEKYGGRGIVVNANQQANIVGVPVGPREVPQVQVSPERQAMLARLRATIWEAAPESMIPRPHSLPTTEA